MEGEKQKTKMMRSISYGPGRTLHQVDQKVELGEAIGGEGSTNYNKLFFYFSNVGALIAILLHGGYGQREKVPAIVNSRGTAFYAFVIWIMVAFMGSAAATIGGGNSKLMRFWRLCSQVSMFLALSTLAFVLVPELDRYICFGSYSTM